MSVYQCSVCGHIELKGVPEKCLVCRAPQSAFQAAPDALKRAVDPANPTEAEQKHIPKIVVVPDCGLLDDCTDVHVKVGEIPHVMTPEHYISYIDAYINEEFVSRIWLSPAGCNAAAGLHLKASTGKFTAIEHCNQHGNWIAEVEL